MLAMETCHRDSYHSSSGYCSGYYSGYCNDYCSGNVDMKLCIKALRINE